MSVVDCHSHAYPAWIQAAFHRWLDETGSMDEGPRALWSSPAFGDPGSHVRSMTESGIDAAVITFSSNAIAAMHAAARQSVPPRRGGTDLIRLVNGEVRSWAAATGGRLLATRWVDPCLPESALAEIALAAEDGGIPAISMHTAYQRAGELRFLDDPEFLPVLRAAAAADVTVFVHASAKFRLGRSGGLDPRADACLTGGLGMLIENTACIARLILRGTFDQVPGLRAVFGQLGGFLPFVLGRFDMLQEMLAPAGEGTARAATALPRLRDHAGDVYLDTHSMDLSALECALDAVGSQRIVFGSDYPVTPGHIGRSRALTNLRRAALGAEELNDIQSGTARRILRLPPTARPAITTGREAAA